MNLQRLGCYKYLLLLVGITIFTNKSVTYVDKVYLWYFHDLKIII